jgi:hypothetical protein
VYVFPWLSWDWLHVAFGVQLAVARSWRQAGSAHEPASPPPFPLSGAFASGSPLPPSEPFPPLPPELLAAPPEELELPPELLAAPPEELELPPELLAAPPEELELPPELLAAPPEEPELPPELPSATDASLWTAPPSAGAGGGGALLVSQPVATAKRPTMAKNPTFLMNFPSRWVTRIRNEPSGDPHVNAPNELLGLGQFSGAV